MTLGESLNSISKKEEAKEQPKPSKNKKLELVDKFITLQSINRSCNKTLTIISGLDLFVIPLKDAEKSKQKQFGYFPVV